MPDYVVEALDRLNETVSNAEQIERHKIEMAYNALMNAVGVYNDIVDNFNQQFAVESKPRLAAIEFHEWEFYDEIE